MSVVNLEQKIFVKLNASKFVLTYHVQIHFLVSLVKSCCSNQFFALKIVSKTQSVQILHFLNHIIWSLFCCLPPIDMFCQHVVTQSHRPLKPKKFLWKEMKWKFSQSCHLTPNIDVLFWLRKALMSWIEWHFSLVDFKNDVV